MTSELTSNDKNYVAALFYALADDYDASLGDMIPPDLFNAIEQLIEARLTKQREGIAEAIEDMPANRTQHWGGGFWSVSRDAAARIARDYQPKEA